MTMICCAVGNLLLVKQYNLSHPKNKESFVNISKGDFIFTAA